MGRSAAPPHPMYLALISSKAAYPSANLSGGKTLHKQHKIGNLSSRYRMVGWIFIVNSFEGEHGLEKRRRILEDIFKTDTGRHIYAEMFGMT